MKWSKDQIETLKELYPETPTPYLAKLFGKSEGAIRSKAKKLGIRKRKFYGKLLKFTPEIIEEMRKLYEEGYSACSIAKLFNTRHQTVLYHLRKKGIEIRRRNYFQKPKIKIPTDKGVLGYIAGLLDGEGGIHFNFNKKRKTLSIEVAICNTNFQIIDWLKRSLNAGHISEENKPLPHARTRKTLYKWRLSTCADVLLLLRALLPHLRIKKDSALKAIKFCEDMLEKKGIAFRGKTPDTYRM